MILVDSEVSNHSVKLIPRYEPSDSLTLNIKNEFTSEKTSLVIEQEAYVYEKGYFIFYFPFTFVEKLTYEFTIKESDRVVFIGKFKAEAFELDTNNAFNYELNFSF